MHDATGWKTDLPFSPRQGYVSFLLFTLCYIYAFLCKAETLGSKGVRNIGICRRGVAASRSEKGHTMEACLVLFLSLMLCCSITKFVRKPLAEVLLVIRNRDFCQLSSGVVCIDIRNNINWYRFAERHKDALKYFQSLPLVFQRFSFVLKQMHHRRAAENSMFALICKLLK